MKIRKKRLSVWLFYIMGSWLVFFQLRIFLNTQLEGQRADRDDVTFDMITVINHSSSKSQACSIKKISLSSCKGEEKLSCISQTSVSRWDKLPSGGVHPPLPTVKRAQMIYLECMTRISMIKLKHDSHLHTWGLQMEAKASEAL